MWHLTWDRGWAQGWEWCYNCCIRDLLWPPALQGTSQTALLCFLDWLQCTARYGEGGRVEGEAEVEGAGVSVVCGMWRVAGLGCRATEWSFPGSMPSCSAYGF